MTKTDGRESIVSISEEIERAERAVKRWPEAVRRSSGLDKMNVSAKQLKSAENRSIKATENDKA